MFRDELGMVEGLFLHRCSEYRFIFSADLNFGAKDIAAQFSPGTNFGATGISGGFSDCFPGLPTPKIPSITKEITRDQFVII